MSTNRRARALPYKLTYEKGEVKKKMKDRTFLIYLSIVMTINVILSAVMLFR